MSLRFAVFENEDDTLAQIILASTINIVRDNGSKNMKLMKSILEKIFVETCSDPTVSCPFTTPGFHLSFRLVKEAIWLLKDDGELLNKGKTILFYVEQSKEFLEPAMFCHLAVLI